MELSKKKVEELVELLRKWYPKWKGFSDPRFVKDEIDYKKATIEKAKKLLSEKELKRFVGDYAKGKFILHDTLCTLGASSGDSPQRLRRPS